MGNDVLLRFLSKGLVDVGGDDNKLGYLRQTAVDLSELLNDRPAKATPFALVAFDPNVPTTDPTIVQVEDALRNRWETFVNTFSGKPVTVLRAILLDALVRACGQDDSVAVAFVALARNVLPFMEANAEHEIWTEILLDIERRVEELARRQWATPASISTPDVRFDSPPAAEIRSRSKKANGSTLAPKFEAVAGPQTIDANGSQRDTGGNPYWLQNNPQHWVREFGMRTAEVVAEAIDRAMGPVSDASAGLQRRTDFPLSGAIVKDNVSESRRAVALWPTRVSRRGPAVGPCAADRQPGGTG